MMFDYLFLSWRYDQFAFQAEFISTISIQSKNNTASKLLNDYLPYRQSMAYHMRTFNQQTSTMWGWVKSFVPGTVACAARTQLGKQLSSANRLYLKISFNYFKEKKKKVDKENLSTPSPKKETSIMPKPAIWKKPITRLAEQEIVTPALSKNGFWRG